MKIEGLSTAFTTNEIAETKEFYLKYFQAKLTFDCGWYVNLKFGSDDSTLQFMAPQQPEHQLASGAGLTYNIAVGDVDQTCQDLTGAGLELLLPLEDHPWGDCGFAVSDPNGIMLYIYSEREPDESFKQFYLD